MDNATAAPSIGGTIRPEEAAHFGRLAAEWWDAKGSSAMLHRLNPVRLGFVREAVDAHWRGDVAALKGTPRGLWPIGAAHAATAAASILGDAVAYATPRIVLQLKCEGIDLRSQGDITPREGDEDFHARTEDPAWWRLVVRHGQLAGGLYVGPPGTAKAFTKLLQQPPDFTPLRESLRAGSLEGLKRLVRLVRA